MENSEKYIESLVESGSILRNIARDIKIIASEIDDECDKSKPDKDVLKALMKSLKRFLEDYFPSDENECVSSSTDVTISLKLEGVEKFIQQLKSIEDELNKVKCISVEKNIIIHCNGNINEIAEQVVKQLKVSVSKASRISPPKF